MPIRLLLAAFAAAIGLAVLGTTPPANLGAAGAFDRAAAMADVRAIAQAPHPTASAENARVRTYIKDEMRKIGMEVSEREGLLGPRATARLNKWAGIQAPPAKATNLVGILPGTDRNATALMLMSHHDSVWGSPGAGDDSAGVASALTVARQIAKAGKPKRDLILLVTDAEELRLDGARQFFAGDPLLSHIGAIINMEARGGGGRTTLFQTSAGNGEAIALYAASASRPAANSMAVFVYSVLPNDTDLSAAIASKRGETRAAGDWTAWNFAFIGRPGLYHSPMATPERLDSGSLADMGEQVLALSKAVLQAPELPRKSSDKVFFDFFGLGLIVYSAWLGWAMLLICAGLLASALPRPIVSRGLIGGFGRMGELMILTVVAMMLLNKASGAGFLGSGGEANYYDRLAAIPLLEVMVLAGCCGAFLIVFGKGLRDPAERVGSALLLLVLGLLMQWFAPTAAHVVIVPLVLGSIAFAAEKHLPTRIAWGIAALAMALGGGFLLALGHQLVQGVGPDFPSAIALPLASLAVLLVPLWPDLSKRQARQAGLAFLALALIVALWVRFDPIADTVAVYSLAKGG